MGVHDNVAALEAFLEHLGQAEHVLETAAEQLDEESHRIGERKSDLEEWIKAVREDVRELREKTAETALRAPVGQADRLKENARLTDQSADLVASGASAFEGELHATASEAVKTVERVDALEAQRFAPLAALLEEQQAAFTTFVEATGAPLDDLLEALQEATERQDGVESEAVGALKEAEQGCDRDHQLALSADGVADTLGSELPQEVTDKIDEGTDDVIEQTQKWFSQLEREVQARQAQAADLGRATAARVREEVAESTAAFAGATEALEEARSELERAAIAAGAARLLAASVQDLAPRARTAQSEVEEIRSLTEALGTP